MRPSPFIAVSASLSLSQVRLVLRHHQAILFAGLDAVLHSESGHRLEGVEHAGNVADHGVDAAGVEIEKNILLRLVALDVAKPSAD